MAPRLGILLSHPVQYQVPWFQHLAERLDLDVYYAHRQDEGGQARAGFGVGFAWDIPLLDGYRYHWLTNVAKRPGIGHFRGCDTPELYKLIDRRRFDAFLVFGWNRKSSWQAITACWRSGVPVFMRGDSQLQTRRSPIRTVAKFLPYRILLPRIDAHLFVGRRNWEYLRRYGVPEERLFFSPHFVDNHFFANASAAAVSTGAAPNVREDLGIPPRAFVAIFVGKFIAVKRPLDFVRGVLKACAASGGDQLHAILVGDGPLRPSLEAEAARAANVHFVGFRNQSELPRYYAAADALVLPGEETWGLVVNEAMACGLPCVVSDAAGCRPDLLVDGQTGYGYPPGDVDALAERLIALREDRRARADRIRRAVLNKVAQYSVSAATMGLQQALETTTGRAPPRARAPLLN